MTSCTFASVSRRRFHDCNHINIWQTSPTTASMLAQSACAWDLVTDPTRSVGYAFVNFEDVRRLTFSLQS
jgi:hypothetical protein